MDASGLTSLLFSGGSALSGLILIFLGGLLETYDRFDAQQKSAIRKKYRRRAVICYVGFLFSVLSALTALALTRFPLPFLEALSLAAILISFGFVVALATLAVKEV